MPANQTPREFAATEINQCRADLNAPGDVTADQLFAAGAVRAQLAIAAALLDVADAIRDSGTGPAVERSMRRLTATVQNLGGP